MSQEEKKIAKKLAEAFKVLPDAKKEYLIGFAEGVASVSDSKNSDENLDRATRQIDRR